MFKIFFKIISQRQTIFIQKYFFLKILLNKVFLKLIFRTWPVRLLEMRRDGEGEGGVPRNRDSFVTEMNQKEKTKGRVGKAVWGIGCFCCPFPFPFHSTFFFSLTLYVSLMWLWKLQLSHILSFCFFVMDLSNFHYIKFFMLNKWTKEKDNVKHSKIIY